MNKSDVVHVCPIYDTECGDYPAHWCNTCPKREALAKKQEATVATLTQACVANSRGILVRAVIARCRFAVKGAGWISGRRGVRCIDKAAPLIVAEMLTARGLVDEAPVTASPKRDAQDKQEDTAVRLVFARDAKTRGVVVKSREEVVSATKAAVRIAAERCTELMDGIDDPEYVIEHGVHRIAQAMLDTVAGLMSAVPTAEFYSPPDPWNAVDSPPQVEEGHDHVACLGIIEDPLFRLKGDEAFVDIVVYWPATKKWTVTAQCRADKTESVDDQPVIVTGWKPIPAI